MSWFSWEPKIAGAITKIKLLPILKEFAPHVILNDRDYFIPADPEDVIYRSPAKQFTYLKQRRDYDDFVRIFRGWLSKKGWGNLLAMDCVLNYYSPNKKKIVCHNAIAFLQDGKLIFGEPQNGKLVHYKQVKIIRLIA